MEKVTEEKREVSPIEKAYTALRIAAKEEQLACKEKLDRAKELYEVSFKQLQALFTQHPNERFAVKISGSYKSITLQGPRSNEYETISFTKIFLGRISNNPILTIVQPEQPASLQFCTFPLASVFEMDSGITITDQSKYTPKKELSLRYGHVFNDMYWTIPDFLEPLMPEDIKAILKQPKKDLYRPIQIELFIGNERFKQIIKSVSPAKQTEIIEMVDGKQAV